MKVDKKTTEHRMDYKGATYYFCAAEGDKNKAEGKELASLSILQDGECGKIAFLRGDKSTVQRLTDMGLTKGVEIKVLKTAPFRGPIEILVRGSKLAVGHELTRKIFVEK